VNSTTTSLSLTQLSAKLLRT